MNSIDSDSNAIVTVNTIDVCTQGLEDTELKANNMMVVGTDNNYEAQIEDLDDLDITVAKKEYVITGDDIYIPQLYDDAPQWMKDLVGLVVDVSMTTNNTQLVNDLNKMLQEFAVSYVPLNQYTQSILDLGNEDMRLNALIETLNSNFNDGLSESNAQIINLMMTKASKDEVLSQVIQTLAAELANPDSNLGATVVRLEQAIVTEQTARATSFEALTASMESIDGEIAAKAEVLENALAYVGIDEAGASTNTGLSAYLEASDGTIGGADSQLANTIRVTAEGVESKWAYNSVVNINGVYRKSGFGLTTNNFSGNGTKANPYTSEFWIDATKLRFTNSANTGRTAPFTIDASGTTPKVKFNGVVEFSNVANTPVINKTFVQTSQPTSGMNKGDTWIDTDDKNTLYTYNGSTWVKTQSGTKTYLQTRAPTSGMSAGDIWVDSDGNYKQYRYNGSTWVAIAYNAATDINNNTTTINGGKITTGSITANQIKANSVSADRLTSTNGRSTVWAGGGLISTNFNGNVSGNIGNPSTGFRLSSNAAGTSADPNIYGAYIKGATLEGSTLKGTSLTISDVKVSAENYPNNFGSLFMIRVASNTQSFSSILSETFVSGNSSSGFNKNRMCKNVQEFLIESFVTAIGFEQVRAITLRLYVSVNGGAWRVFYSVKSAGHANALSNYTHSSAATQSIRFKAEGTAASATNQSIFLKVTSINGQ